MSNMVVLPKDFDEKHIKNESMKTNALGGKVVYMSYNDKKNIVMQTPMLSAPFGLSTYTDEKTGITKFSLDVSFKGMENDQKIHTFYDKMEALDNHILSLAEENSKEWLGKKMSREVVEALYRPIIKQAKDPEKYSPTMKFKITNTSKGDINVEAYDNERNRVDMKDIIQGSKVRCIIECSSIWFVNKQFGVSWKLLQTEITKPDKITGFSFIEDSDDDDDDDDEYEESDNEDEVNL